MSDIFEKEKIDSAIHFAGFKAVGESVEKPLEYYRNNLLSTMNLLECMREHKVFDLVFSSSSTVYGTPETVPVTEDTPRGQTTNPYGQTKAVIERMMEDVSGADDRWHIMLLRYFNPVGAHASGLIGEDPKGIPNNLMPYITQVAVGKMDHLNVFGDDYDTPDGTGIRDYIHVVDLARGHVCALDNIRKKQGLNIYNLGTGIGYSVLDMVKAFEKSTGVKIPYVITKRRQGDIAKTYADPSKAKKELSFETKYTLEDMCHDAYYWQQKNPDGYGS